MSNRVIDACRPLRVRPVPKNVLMAIADRARDEGTAWPSIADLCETTCFGKSAVIEAIQWLEQQGLLLVERRDGRNSLMTIQLDAVRAAIANQVTNQSATRSGSRGSPPREPVRHADPTPPPGGPHPSATRTPPVRHADPNHQEPSENHQGTHASARGEIGKALKQAGLDPMRFSLNDPRLAPLIDAGVTPQEFYDVACEAVSKGKRSPFAWVLSVVQSRREEAARMHAAGVPVTARPGQEQSGRLPLFVPPPPLSAEEKAAADVARRAAMEKIGRSFRERELEVRSAEAAAWMGEFAPATNPPAQGDVVEMPGAIDALRLQNR